MQYKVLIVTQFSFYTRILESPFNNVYRFLKLRVNYGGVDLLKDLLCSLSLLTYYASVCLCECEVALALQSDNTL